jgi:hypothetical protein
MHNFFFFYFIHSVSYVFLFLLSFIDFNKQVQWTQTRKCHILYAFNKRKKILYKITHIRNIIQKQILFIYIKHKEIIDESK